jgi:hypothetical protein
VAPVFIGQFIGTLQRAKGPKAEQAVAKARSEVDSEFGLGTFDALTMSYDCRSTDFYIWSIPGPIRGADLFARTSKVLLWTRQAAFAFPRAFLEHRLCNLGGLLQITDVTQPFATTIVQNQLGLVPNSRFPALRLRVVHFLESSHSRLFVFRHYLFLGFVLIAGVVAFWRKDVLLAIPAIGGASYFGTFLLHDGYPDWRFLFTTFLFGCVCSIALLERLLCRSERPPSVAESGEA